METVRCRDCNRVLMDDWTPEVGVTSTTCIQAFTPFGKGGRWTCL